MTTTKDGKWEYGVGEYQKKLSDYLGYQAPGASSSVSGSIVDFLFPAYAKMKNVSYSMISSVTIPVFYIWARSKLNEVKRIVEWPFSKSTRDAMYPNFALSMEAPITDIQRVAIISQLQATAGAPSMTNLSKWLATEKYMLTYNEVSNQVYHQAFKGGSDGSESAVIPLLIGTIVAVAVIVLVFRKS